MLGLDYLTFAVALALGILFYVGWPRGKRWARICLILVVIVLLCGALAIGLYVSAMGQANWSL